MKGLKVVVFFCFVSFAFQFQAQRLFNSKKKISNAKGTFFMQWGYQRSFYTQSELNLSNQAYKFTLRNVTASDDPTKKIGDYLKASTFFQTQYSVKSGYYYMNKYALTFGLDHMKYLMNDGSRVLLDGTIDTSYHAVWSGDYKNKEVVTNSTDFNWQHVGLNFVRVELIRTDKLYQSKNKAVAFSSNFGLGLGAIVSNTGLNFGQKSSLTRSLSGYGITGLASFRLEFFRNFYIQAQLSGGSINQTLIKTESDDPKSFAKQQFWYGQRQVNIGFFHYFKPTNACNDCPVW